MDIFSLLPIILMIVAVVSKLNKGVAKTNQRPRSPYATSSPWANNLETSLQKWLSYRSPIPTSEIVEVRNEFRREEVSLMNNTADTEGTAGTEGSDGVEGKGGVEGTAGLEGAAGSEELFKPTLTTELKTLQLEIEKPPSYPNFSEKNLVEAVIWAEILGKPKARINRSFQRNH